MLRLIAGYFGFLGLLSLLGALPAFAQDNYTRFEFGTQFSTVRLTNSDLGGTNYSGFGGRFDWNLNRRLAFESQIDFFPEHTIPLLSNPGRANAPGSLRSARQGDPDSPRFPCLD